MSEPHKQRRAESDLPEDDDKGVRKGNGSRAGSMVDLLLVGSDGIRTAWCSVPRTPADQDLLRDSPQSHGVPICRGVLPLRVGEEWRAESTSIGPLLGSAEG